MLYCFVSETTHRDLARLCAACRAFLTCSRTSGPREAYPLGAPEASTGKNEEPELLRKLHSTFQTPNSPGGAGSPTARLA